jgi:hypothetical protein
MTALVAHFCLPSFPSTEELFKCASTTTTMNRMY